MRGLYLMFALLSVRAIAQNAEPAGPATPRLIEKVAAEYSDEANLAGFEGTVVLRVMIAEDGTARDVQVAQPLGLGLDEKALEAAKRWRFTSSPGRQPVPLNFEVDFLLPAKQSRWHLTRVVFEPPEGASRPVFLTVKYPLGSGIALDVQPLGIDEARIVAAVGRQAWAVVSFDVDKNGFPANFEVPNVSADVWKNQAIALVRQWRFTPGMKDGKPIPVRCTLNLVWGDRNLSLAQLAAARPAETPRQQARPPVSNPSFPPPAPGVARIELSASAQYDRLIQRVAPEYPPGAMQAGMGGVVLFNVLIGTDGHVRQAVAVSRTSTFIPAAARALMQWVYRPGSVNGNPAEMTTVVPMEVP